MKKLVFISFLIVLVCCVGCKSQTSGNLTDEQILELIQKHRPSMGGAIPADLKDRLGATHMDGQYYFTSEPYIIEGAKKMTELGYGILKLWFSKANGNAGGYQYNSDWKLTRSMTFTELAQHPYWKEVFDMPFRVFALNINEGFGRASTEDQTETLNRIENEFYDLTKYLLSQYKDRDVTIILEMWEGDWTLRGGTGSDSRWKENGVPADAPIRVKNFIDWVTARQKGVDRARNEITNSKCTVYHAIEVNRVFDGLEGIPTLTTDVLPKVKVDMVSWSSYDGRSSDGLLMYRGIDIIRQHLIPTAYMKGKKVVFIGEVGRPENIENQTRESIREFWDLNLGVYFAQDIPYIIQWELFCNEPKVGPKSQDRNKTTDELRGFWLIRPDGSKGWAQEYFEEILSNNPNLTSMVTTVDNKTTVVPNTNLRGEVTSSANEVTNVAVSRSVPDRTKLDGIATQTFTIGENYGGGKIFWLDSSGQHGLIAATSDQSTGIQWYNGSNTVTGASLDGVYAGKANTGLIIKNQGEGSYAAQVCNDYAVTVNNEYYDDWYLPSKYELNLLYTQKDIVGGFDSCYYWSSTENYNILNLNPNAFGQGFEDGRQYYSGYSKNFTFNVRAVRAF